MDKNNLQPEAHESKTEQGAIGESFGRAKTKKSKRSLWARLLLVAAGTLLAVAVGELLVRAFVPPRPTIRWKQMADFAQRQHEVEVDRVFMSDPELFWRLAPDVRLPNGQGPLHGVISNSRGLREDHEIPWKKRPGEVRILFLGDSCTFGALLSHSDTYVQGVENRLRARFPTVPIECINAGVPGYTLFQGWRFLETEGFRYQPDLVVLYFGWNEPATWGASDMDHYRAWQAAQPIPALRWSRICQLLWRATHPSNVQESGSSRRARLLPDEFSTLLSQVHESTRRHRVKLLLIVGPHRNNIASNVPRNLRSPYQVELYKYGKSMQFGPDGSHGYVDLVPEIQAMAADHPSSALFFDLVHATALTNRSIARAVAMKLEPWVKAHISEQ